MALSVAQTLLTTLQTNDQLKQLCSSFGYGSELEKLKNTVASIQAVLLQVDGLLALSYGQQNLVERLKDAVYDADDLLDEFITVAELMKPMPAAKIFEKVRRLFYGNNQLIFGYSESLEIKKLREKLDECRKFGFDTTIKRGREETMPFVDEENIIGRERDKENVVGMLLSETEDNVCCVSIVGMEGLGKTTLAQLVFNDDKIKEVFSDGMYWVCASQEFGMKGILGKLLGKEGISLEEMQTQARHMIENKRYLLVLDDVWSENRVDWVDLIEFLGVGVRGSRILVTSRSKKVANVAGSTDDLIHELKGLSDEESWDLFSYHNLTPQLKACFSFCSLFPKSYVIDKQLLIRCWMAQGYLIPSNKGQSMQDVGEEYFSILMQRCFFQYFKQDTFGRVESCKMHDAMHDLAQHVAGKEALVLTSNTHSIKNKIRHLSTANFEDFNNWCGPSYCSSDTLRTLLLVEHSRNSAHYVMTIITNYTCLRVLDLRSSGIRNLPSTIGKLIHLRYLDLSYNKSLKNLPTSITNLHNLQTLILRGCDNLEELTDVTSKLVNLTYLDLSYNRAWKNLPKSITNLHNLQALIIRNCEDLEELPEDTSKLVNLRILDIFGCNRITHMPIGMCKLTCLHTLLLYVVGADDSKLVKKADLADLKPLINQLRDELHIKFVVGGYANYQFRDGNVKDLRIRFDYKDNRGDAQEMLVEHLPCNNHYLINFVIEYYQGKKWPSWASPMADRFPRLVEIRLEHSGGLKHLTSLSQLSHLKVVHLKHMQNLEWIENDYSPLMPFFPSLEKLTLDEMPKLKGCLVDDNRVDQHLIPPSFPCLRELTIWSCRNMMYFPPCPHLKRLHIGRVNDGLSFCTKGGTVCLDYLEIDNKVVFNSLFRVFLRGAVSVKIINLQEVESFVSLREGIEHLTNLQSLTLFHCGDLSLKDERNGCHGNLLVPSLPCHWNGFQSW